MLTFYFFTCVSEKVKKVLHNLLMLVEGADLTQFVLPRFVATRLYGGKW
jgi:hypothetical protein